MPRGTEFTGNITQSDASGRLEGRAVLAVTLDTFQLNGKDYRVYTGSVEHFSAAHKKRNLGFIGAGKGLGAALGAIAGGGTGALIGAASGAAAGTAGAAATGKLEVGISAESLLTFPLRAALTHCLSKDRAHRKSDRVANNVCSLSRPVFEGSLLIRWRLRSTDATRPETAARRLCRGRK